jgi:membrane-associated protein
MADLVNFILHIDKELIQLSAEYGSWLYGILFVVVFVETGVVIFPFLPGDSLLFAAGALAAVKSLDIWLVFGFLFIAAFLGDTLNYWIGHYLGPKVFQKPNSRLLRPEHLEETHRYFEKYGNITIVIARFIPIVRTIAPFVAGVGRMPYRSFLAFNLVGGLIWVSLFVFGGYFFGQLAFVQNHFSVVVLAIIALSVLPALFELWRHRRKSRQKNLSL